MKFTRSVLGLIFAFTISCNEPSAIGSDFFENGSLDIIYTDTLSLIVSTTVVDSIATNGKSRLLVGHHTDDDLGVITASAFFQLEPRTSDNKEFSTYNLEDISSDYLRTTLTLWYDSYSYYDTLENQTFYVHQLSNEIELHEDDNLYNISETSYDPLPLGQLSFKPRPVSGDSIEIPISDLLGGDIYNRAIVGDDQLASTDDFVEEILKGLVVLPDITKNGAVLGFDTEAELRVYYLDRTTVPNEERYIRFFVSSLRYNQVRADRSLTLLNDLVTLTEPINSSLTNQKAYVQGGSGLYIRVEIPHLKTILIDNPELIITQADLTFKPIKNSFTENTPLPSQLTLYAVGKSNKIYAVLSNSETGTGFANLIEDNDLGRDTYYGANVVEFIKSQLATEEFNSNALLLSLSDTELQSSVNRLYVGNQLSDFDMELKVYFAVIR